MIDRRSLLALAGATAASPALAEMTLTSPDFADGATLPQAQVFNAMGCTGGNTSPALEWSGAPEGTKSFLLTAYDPDAPTGSGWWHWTVANIPGDVTGLPAGASPAALPEGAVEGRTDFGAPGFGGAWFTAGAFVSPPPSFVADTGARSPRPGSSAARPKNAVFHSSTPSAPITNNGSRFFTRRRRPSCAWWPSPLPP